MRCPTPRWTGSHVWVTLTDERWVEATSSDSNEQLVRAHLLRNAAAKAPFCRMKTDAPRRSAGRCRGSWSAIAPLPRPFDYLLLGMGDDGHTASLFPGSPGLQRRSMRCSRPAVSA
jgi:6-phosphogluconolactonase